MKKTILLVLVVLIGMVTEQANADFVFGEPMNLGSTVNSSAGAEDPEISADGLKLYFNSNRAGGYGKGDLWVTTRSTVEDNWEIPVNLGPTVNSSSDDFAPDVSPDGLILHFASDRPGGFGNYDLWVTSRATMDDDWATPVNLGPTINSSDMDGCPAVSDDGLELYFWSNRPGGSGSIDLWIAKRATIEDDWDTPVNLGPVINSSAMDFCPHISVDGRLLFFISGRSGGYGGFYGDIWITTRHTLSDPWGTPMNLGPIVNSPASEGGPALSSDGTTFYFSSDRPGGFGSYDLFEAAIIPVVDLNGDGIVDSADMRIMVDHWGEDYPLCDIGPMPWGDGTVDVHDLIVLSQHLFEEVFQPELIAYWKLDETAGDIAYNSISDNHGVLSGNPTWQPDSGHADGALQFDGVDGYITTDFVLNPVTNPFSVFTWIKDGAPGQVIISQSNGANWLGADADTGCLMTELMPPAVGRFVPQPLKSDAVITDGQWYRIGFVWDGSYRCLYVDGIEVARDAQALNLAPLKSANGGLYIGTSKTLDAGTFFSGLIDDVRIYNKALSAEEIAALSQ